MNWNALNAISTTGMLIVMTVQLLNPSLNDKGFYFISILLILLLLLNIYHFLFRLIRNGLAASRVYLVRWGIKHWIENPETLRKLGHTPDEVEPISKAIFHLYPTGKSINYKKHS